MTPLSAAELPLSAAMRTGSERRHREAESSAFMTHLLAGRVGRRAYVAYLLRLRTVYRTLEALVRAHGRDPIVGAVADPALERLAALEVDLDHWAPGCGRHVDSASAAAYCRRLEEAADSGGHLLLAHHYTRYLGDLSGGRIIGRAVDRTFGLDGHGITFYDFPAVASPKRYKDAYRARLDELSLTPAQARGVVAEVNVAFGLNKAMFAELDRTLETGPEAQWLDQRQSG